MSTNVFAQQIMLRICDYYDIGVHFIGHINTRLTTCDLNTVNWSRLFDPNGFYEDYDFPEEAIIQDVLIQSGRIEFIDGESDMQTHIRQGWESGCEDLEKIVEYLVEYRQQLGLSTFGISDEMVMAVLELMGYII